jgi:hypothetical protein
MEDKTISKIQQIRRQWQLKVSEAEAKPSRDHTHNSSSSSTCSTYSSSSSRSHDQNVIDEDHYHYRRPSLALVADQIDVAHLRRTWEPPHGHQSLHACTHVKTRQQDIGSDQSRAAPSWNDFHAMMEEPMHGHGSFASIDEEGNNRRTGVDQNVRAATTCVETVQYGYHSVLMDGFL